MEGRRFVDDDLFSGSGLDEFDRVHRFNSNASNEKPQVLCILSNLHDVGRIALLHDSIRNRRLGIGSFGGSKRKTFFQLTFWVGSCY